MTDAETVERVARAIHGASCIAEPWDYLMEFQRLRYMDQARAALASLQPHTVAEAADRIQLNPPDIAESHGILDEIVFSNCTAHLEQMSKDGFFLGLTRGGDFFQVWINRHGKSLQASYEISGPNEAALRALTKGEDRG
ncbi:hypothetical protein [Ruegeria sp. HKCCD6109]|uniref:hypothetical protein n=1 Tax=Ruegeria sp. HKCCD6109 TaxID=2683017 RepID=UPI001491435F|nr:hypothetical protein [Ruegeria sp. HKCCD6109]NOD65773.1 hypothetical protein [Ruegeria sp. HKCCD6109]